MGADKQIALVMSLCRLHNFCKDYCLEQHLDMGDNDPILRSAEGLLIEQLLKASHHATDAEVDQLLAIETNTTMRDVLLSQIRRMGICRPTPVV